MKKSIGIAGLIWSASLLLSRVSGLLRERVLGTTLGVGGEADVYQAAFRVPDLINYLVAGGALSIVFIPLFTAHLERGDEARAWRSFSILANFLVGALGSLIVVGMVAMPWLVGLLAPGFSPEQLSELSQLSRIVLPAQLFHLLGGLLSAALLSKERHAVPALAPLLYTGSIIAGGLWTGTAEGFAWGVLIGAILGPFGLPLWACLREGLRWQLIFDPRDPDFRSYLYRSLPIMLGWSIVGMDETVVTWFASSFAEGSVAILGYARTLMKVPMGVFGMAMGIAAYPTLTRLCAEEKTGEAWKILARASRQVLVLAFGSQVILTVAGPELGALVYSARKIQPDQLAEMGRCLGIFSLALGAWTVQTLLARGFYARGKTWLPTWLGFGVLVLALPIYAGLAPYGSTGLALASSLGITAYTLLLGVVLWREMGRQPGGG
ncbi:MAG TPA: murein biosynthesis integral membrane protein MurJ, partial [Myxococcota bacterium]|nr:murein biosynthesis integral membrane protein MurJ [Myxococcota bacterium]